MPREAERTPSHDLESSITDSPTRESLDRLRELLLGTEIREIAQLREQIESMETSAETIAEKLPSAIVLRASRDTQLSQALSPTIEDSLHDAVQRNPQKITDAIFPILGPAIRKSIAETMASLVQTINRAIESSFSLRGLKWRMESWRTGVPFGQVVIKHALVYRVEQLFLIHGETGLLLAHVTADGVATPDADVISGMLTAIKDFVHDSFHAETGHGMRRVSVAEHTIIAEQGPHALLGAVVRGQAPEELNQRLAEILERIHLMYGPALRRFDGDSGDFNQTAPLLATGLETQLATERADRSVFGPITTWSLAGLLVFVGLFFVVRGALRWNRALAALEDAPGIVVIEDSRGLRGGKISALVDPGATDPMEIIAVSGLDTSRVRARFSAFLSLDSAVIRQRVERFLDVPAEMRVSVDGGRVQLTGSATPSWMRTALENRFEIPGIREVDLGSVSIALPANLESIRARIQSRRVPFGVGSSALTDQANALIDTLRSDLNAAQTEGSALNLTMIVKLVGRTDRTGATETNAVLSQRRAEAVRDRLLTDGSWGLTEFVATGIGTSAPVTGASETETARLNRSVTPTLEFALTGLPR